MYFIERISRLCEFTKGEGEGEGEDIASCRRARVECKAIGAIIRTLQEVDGFAVPRFLLLYFSLYFPPISSPIFSSLLHFAHFLEPIISPFYVSLI